MTRLLTLCMLFVICGTFASSQTFEWAKYGSTDDTEGTLKGEAIALDSSGNIYVVGLVDPDELVGKVMFGGLTTGFVEYGDGVVVKYDPNGTPQWAKTIGSGRGGQIFSVCTDAQGNVYVAGQAGHRIDEPGGPAVKSSQDLYGYIVSLTPDGDWRWTAIDTAAQRRLYRRVMCDRDGDIIAVGEQGRADRFLTRRVLMAKYSNAGERLWATVAIDSLPEGGEGTVNDVLVGPDNNIVVIGLIMRNVRVGDSVIHLPNSYFNLNSYIASFSDNGKLQWLRLDSLGGSLGRDSLYIGPMASDNAGTIYLLRRTGRVNALLEYAPDGSQTFRDTIGTTGGPIALMPSGNIMVAAVAYAGTRIDTVTLTRGTTSDPQHSPTICFAELTPQGKLVALTQTDGNGIQYANGIVADAHGNTFATGYFAGQGLSLHPRAQFGPIAMNSSSGGVNLFVTKVVPGVSSVPLRGRGEHLIAFQPVFDATGGSVRLCFQLDSPLHLSMTLCDPAGHIVATIADENFGEGAHVVDFNTASLSSGIYFCRVVGGGSSFVAPVAIVR